MIAGMLEVEHRLGPVPATFHRLRGMHVDSCCAPTRMREEARVVAAALARRRDEVRRCRRGRSGVMTRSCSASASVKLRAARAAANARRSIRASRSSSPLSARSTTDEDADLLEHLAHTGDRVASGSVPSAASTAPPGKTNASGCEAAPARTAEHADLDTAVDIAEQRDGARRDGSGDSVGHHGAWYGRVEHGTGGPRHYALACNPISRSRSNSPTSPTRSRWRASGRPICASTPSPTARP